MTAASHPYANAQQLYQQLGELADVVRPLADRLMAAGSWENAVAEAKQMAAEHVISRFQAQFQGHSANVTTQPDANSTAGGENATPFAAPFSQNTGVNAGSLLGALGEVAMGGAAAAGGSAMLGIQVGVQGLRMAQQGFKDYTETVERERTARHDITAQKEIRLAEIDCVRLTLENYLTRTFDERRSNFDALFSRLDVAQQRGDVQGMQLVLASILDLAKSSPFKDLAAFKASLEDPNFVLEL